MSALSYDELWDAAQYLEWERNNENRHELIDGYVVAMTGVSRAHNLITTNITTWLNIQLRERDCEVYSSDMRVQVRASGTYTYPDVVVVCGSPEFTDDHVDTLMNPTVLIEVLSPSTELVDRVQKLAQYRTLPSVQDYLLVTQSVPRIERYTRRDEGWLYTDVIGINAVMQLASIDCQMTLADVYAKVTFGDGD